MRKNKIPGEGTEDEVLNTTTEGVNEKGIDVKSDPSEKNGFNPSSCSSPKVKSDKTNKAESKKDLFKCEKCDYKVKKEDTLKKHMITKHDGHVCKECNKNMSSFMELLKHVAKMHTKETVEGTDQTESEKKVVEVVQYVEVTGMKDTEYENVEKDNKVTLSESMLDTILLEGY